MKRVLLTGTSGVGKSTVVGRINSSGTELLIRTITASPKRSIQPQLGSVARSRVGIGERLCGENRMQDRLPDNGDDVLFADGTSRDQVEFYPQIRRRRAAIAPASVLVERLSNRMASRLAGLQADSKPIARRVGQVELGSEIALRSLDRLVP